MGDYYMAKIDSQRDRDAAKMKQTDIGIFIGIFGGLNLVIGIGSFILAVIFAFSATGLGGALTAIFMFFVACGAFIIGSFSLYIYRNYDFFSKNKIALYLFTALPVASFSAFILLAFFGMFGGSRAIIEIFALTSLPLMLILMIIIAIVKKRAEIKEMMQAIKEIQEKRNINEHNEEIKHIFKD